jgi:hypothetical protein
VEFDRPGGHVDNDIVIDGHVQGRRRTSRAVAASRAHLTSSAAFGAPLGVISGDGFEHNAWGVLVPKQVRQPSCATSRELLRVRIGLATQRASRQVGRCEVSVPVRGVAADPVGRGAQRAPHR